MSTDPVPTGHQPTVPRPDGPQPNVPRPDGPQPNGPQPNGPRPNDSQRSSSEADDPTDSQPVDADVVAGTLPAPLRIDLLAAVAAGGLVGTELRYLLARAEPHAPGGFPMATFSVNIVGAFVLGVVLELLTADGPDTTRRRRLRLLLGTGFCGGFTTYSTFAVDGDLLVRHGSPGLALGYVAATVLLGLALCLAGVAVGTRLNPPARFGGRPARFGGRPARFGGRPARFGGR